MLPVVKCRSRAGRHSHRKNHSSWRCKVSGGGLFLITPFTHSSWALCEEDNKEQLVALMTHFTKHKNMSKIRLWTPVRLLKMGRQNWHSHLRCLGHVRLYLLSCKSPSKRNERMLSRPEPGDTGDQLAGRHPLSS